MSRRSNNRDEFEEFEPRVRDCYVRVYPNADPRPSLPPDGGGSVLFVDTCSDEAEAEHALQSVRALHLSLKDFRAILVRGPHPAPKEENAEALASATRRALAYVEAEHVPVGVLYQPIGEGAGIRWLGEQPKLLDAGDLLRRARAVEIQTLLVWERAIWRPRGYHYRLPNGVHAGVFVRLADAIREPRDADVLASWLAAKIKPDFGLVVDTGSLVSVAIALRERLALEGSKIGPIRILERYPQTQLDVDRAVADVTAHQGGVAALLSVNSTGGARDALWTALHRSSSPEWSLSVVVDKAAPAPFPRQDPERTDTWLGLGFGSIIARRQDGCRLCQDSSRGRYVQIDPRTFDGMVIPAPERIMPDVRDAKLNRVLWEACSGSEGTSVSLDAPPPDGPTENAGNERWPIRFHPSVLLQNESFLAEASKRARERLKRLDDIEKRDREEDPVDPPPIDSLIVYQDVCDSEAFGSVRQMLEVIAERAIPVISVSRDGKWNVGLRRQIADTTRPLVVALGSSSGRSLERLVTGIQDARGQKGWRVMGLVVEARSRSQREWRVLRNHYDRRLEALWLTHLPDRCVLKEERSALAILGSEDLDDDERAFLQSRREEGQPRDLFWRVESMAPGRHVGPFSIFGKELGEVSVFVAVGSAMHAARKADTGAAAPEWRQFHVPDIVGSYYDPLILASVFRWLEPYEAWWGESTREQTNTVDVLLSRSEETPGVLVSEMLLAAAQGKIPRIAWPALELRASTLAKAAPPAETACIRIGLRLLRRAKAESALDDRQVIERDLDVLRTEANRMGMTLPALADD